MNFFEAMKAALDGHKIREKSRPAKEYIVLSITPRQVGNKQIPHAYFINEDGDMYYPSAGDELMLDKYEIYDET